MEHDQGPLMSDPAKARRQLLIFIKHPTPGKVKTRLAQTIGPETACDVYRACVELTLERVRRFCDNTLLYVDPPQALERVRAWVGSSWALRPQQGATLGERLAEATTSAFASEPKSRIVIIGTDSPWLTARELEAVFAALAQTPVCLGPTDDGGYYLIGLSRQAPSLFEGIAWSTAAVFEQTLAQARALRWPVEVLPQRYDLDRLEDVQRFLTEERANGRAPEQLKVIETVLKMSARIA